jgi:Xaa-Pro aminopeptidase
MINKGMAGVDWEERVNFPRLREERLARAQAELEKNEELGALVLFREPNIRYVTSMWSGPWMLDKAPWRFCFLPRGQRPIFYGGLHDYQIQEVHNSTPWLGEIRLAVTWLRGGVGTAAMNISAKKWADEIKSVMKETGVTGMKVGFDLLDAAMVEAVTDAGIEITDGQVPLEMARSVKTEDEMELLRQSAAMATAGYWKVKEALRPGLREREIIAVAAHTCYSLGAETFADIQCVTGPNTTPSLVKCSDRVIDYGDWVNVDIMNQYMGYQVPSHRNFVCGGKPTQKQKDLLKTLRERVYIMIDRIKAGVTSTEVMQTSQLRSGMELIDLPQFIHGVGLSHWERPYISSAKGAERIMGEQRGYEGEIILQENMCLGPETMMTDPSINTGANLQEIGFVTKTGFDIITKFPSDEL